MQSFTSTQMAIAVALAIAVLAVVLTFRAKRSGGRRINHDAPRGPANLHFTCTRCANQTAHTRRTLSAWEKGSRKFFCNNCHKNWREAQPVQNSSQIGGVNLKPQRSSASPSKRPSLGPRSAAPAGAGCLGVLLIVLVLPAVAAVAVLAYA